MNDPSDPFGFRARRPTPQPIAGSEADVLHLALHGCPPLPRTPRGPYPYERAVTMAFQRRLDAGDAGERLLRPLDLQEVARVGWGGTGDATDEMIVARWIEVRRRAAA